MIHEIYIHPIHPLQNPSNPSHQTEKVVNGLVWTNPLKTMDGFDSSTLF